VSGADYSAAVPERERTYAWADYADFAAAVDELPPGEVMRRMAAGDVPQPPIAATLGFALVAVDDGVAVFACEPQAWHYNPIGTVHAGLAMTLLDSAMGCALMTTLDAPRPWTTLEVKANFTRPLTAGMGQVRCKGRVVHPGRTVVTTEARLEGPDGKLHAHGTSTILMLDTSAGPASAAGGRPAGAP
jgi:uncharacterized protein (TIGR00369 family)